MKTVKIPIPLWRKLALEEFTSILVFVKVMENSYGLVRVIDKDTIRSTQRGFISYQIVDEQKYLFFKLKYE